jgi:hypothetical protein
VLPHLSERLRTLARQTGSFASVHVAPDSADIPDEDRARLVILPPTAVHTRRAEGARSAAVTTAADLLERRGTSARLRKNMLVFVAPDAEYEEGLEAEVRRYIAWKSIVEDEALLDLGRAELRQATETRDQADATVIARLRQTYAWLIAPTQTPDGSIELPPKQLPGGDEPPAVRASRSLESSEDLITRWSPRGLRIELDRLLWVDRPGLTVRHVSLKKLWEDLCNYPYLPRLRDRSVLEEAIREGLRSRDYFGYATSVRADGSYAGMTFGAPASGVYFDDDAVLVKPDAAQAQLDAETSVPTGTGDHGASGEAVGEGGGTPGWSSGSTPTGGGVTSRAGGATTPHGTGSPALTRFHATLDVDPLRARKVLNDVVDEVLVHLAAHPDAAVRIRLDIEATSVKGFDETIVMTLSENAKVLKFGSHGFEEE